MMDDLTLNGSNRAHQAMWAAATQRFLLLLLRHILLLPLKATIHRIMVAARITGLGHF
jgi:hypothetical protein